MSFMTLLRAPLERAGYVLWRRNFLRYGVDLFVDVRRLAAKYGRSIDVVFDVGANVGQTTREVLKAFPAAQVLAFEPHPKSFARLQRLSNPRLVANHLALGPQAGTVTLYQYGEDDSAGLRNSLVANAPSTVEFGYRPSQIDVPCSTLDLYCRQNEVERIGLLKLDVEGFELSVLQGGLNLLKTGRVDFIYAEFNELLPIKGATGGALLPLADFLTPFRMRFIATYTDFVDQDGRPFVVANALWARDPD